MFMKRKKKKLEKFQGIYIDFKNILKHININ